jgi:acyl-CoA synthetase (AMP-forming)/AMP-acid ligase II
VVAPGEEGELQVRAPQVMMGYVDASLDAAAFSDGWFRTGDLGVVDADGFVRITGRLKDVIIRNGENISAKEVEDLLFAHPAVADVAVIGLPDERTGERVCAVVCPADGAAPLSLLDAREYLTSRGLRRQAVPEQVEHLDALPRNPAGKVTKQALQDRFATTART